MMNAMTKVMWLLAMSHQAGAADIEWIEDSTGDWFDSANWVQGVVPVSGDQVFFSDTQVTDPPLEVNLDNAGLGVVQPNDQLVLNDKVIFFDAGAGGLPDAVDDVLVFDLIQANGTGGAAVVFEVPVMANLMTSDRHGAVFNQPFSIDVIEARSRHQDKWQLNAPALTPIRSLLIDEDRGPDGGSIDGSFTINADQTIDELAFVWGRLQLGTDVTLSVGHLTYHAFTEQPENNNLSPIIIGENSRILVEQFSIIDVNSGEVFTPENGTAGNVDNPDVDFNTPLIEGSGIIVICRQSIFANNFEQNPETCNN
jgi:hypothetical protein